MFHSPALGTGHPCRYQNPGRVNEKHGLRKSGSNLDRAILFCGLSHPNWRLVHSPSKGVDLLSSGPSTVGSVSRSQAEGVRGGVWEAWRWVPHVCPRPLKKTPSILWLPGSKGCLSALCERSRCSSVSSWSFVPLFPVWPLGLRAAAGLPSWPWTLVPPAHPLPPAAATWPQPRTQL